MVAVAVVVLLAVTGSLPGIPGIFPTKHTPTNGLSFDSARPIADTMAKKLFGSSQLEWAIGIANNRTYAATLHGLARGSCALSGGNTSSFVVPAEQGNLTVGVAAAWVFWFAGGLYTTAFIGVVNGSAVYYGNITDRNGSCIGTYQPNLPSDLIDSSKAATIAAPEAADFARSYSVSMVLYIMNEETPNSSDFYSVWYLDYETCSFGISGPGNSLFVGINATTGATHGLYTGSVAGPINCSLSANAANPFP